MEFVAFLFWEFPVDIVYTLHDNICVIIWDDAKNKKLLQERGVGFEEIVERIAANKILEILEHRSRKNQKIFVVDLNGRIHAVPFLLDELGNIILKTIYPSRKLQRSYGKKNKKGEA